MTAALSGLASSFAEWCAAASLQAAVLALIVAILDGVLGRRIPPRALAALWILVILRFLVPPALASPVRLPAQWEAPWLHAGIPAGAPGREAVAAFLVWLAGCSILGVSCLARRRGIRIEYLAPASRPLPPGVAELLRDAAWRLGLARLPEVRMADGPRGPAVLGSLRPVVVIPSSLVGSATREELSHVLLHELAHVKRRDPLVQGLCVVAQVAFWFHPAVWLARHRLSLLAEVCCDEAVVRALGGSSAEYRRTLLGLARPLLAPRIPAGLAFLRGRSQLLRRIERLGRMDGRAHSGTRSSRVLRALWCGLCALVFFCSPPVPSSEYAAFTPPPLESLEGCLQLRFAVQAALARRGLDQGPNQPPGI